MRLRRATLLAALLAFQGCTCGWGQGNYNCDIPNEFGADAQYEPGDNCNAQGGSCQALDASCDPGQLFYSDCPAPEVCCVLVSPEASSDASVDQDSEASSDAPSDADASIHDGSGDATLEAGDGPTDASLPEATSDDGGVTDGAPDSSGD